MKILTLDFESVWDDQLTLKKMSTEEYCRHERFKAHMVGIKYPHQEPTAYEPWMLEKNPGLRRDIETSAVLMHHAHFDAFILNHHYGLRPAFIFDTLSLARLQLPRLKSHSLDALAQHFGLPAKNVPYNLFKGLETLPSNVWGQVAIGCCHDVTLNWEIFKRLVVGVPETELQVISQTVKMFSEPVLDLDRERLGEFLKEEKLRKAHLMVEVGKVLGLPTPTTVNEVHALLADVETQLQSSEKFRMALESLGYECPMKWSEKARCEACAGGISFSRTIGLGESDVEWRCEACDGTGKGGWIPALAKNDDGMRELLEHDDQRVSALAGARLGVKSTIDETRAQRLLDASGRGRLPVYLSYAAAKTLRFGGGDKTNWQNFRRGGEIRKSIKAPQGHKLVIVDASQVECRGVNWLAGQESILQLFRDRRDVYAELASRMFGRPVTKAEEKERWLGKQVELGSGFGLRWRGLQHKLRTGQMGGMRMALTDEEAQSYMGAYDETHPHVLEFWRIGRDHILPALLAGTDFDHGGFRVRAQKVYLPNGVALDYTGIRYGYFDGNTPARDERPQYWITTKRGQQERVWHGTIVENITQALFSGLLIREAMVRIGARYRIVLQVHDEVVLCVRDDEAESALEFAVEEMSREPWWAPGFPAAAEGIISENYSK